METVLTNIQTGLEALVTQVLPVVGGVIVAGLAFWGLALLVRWARKFFGK